MGSLDGLRKSALASDIRGNVHKAAELSQARSASQGAWPEAAAGRAKAEGAAEQARAELVSTSQAEVARAQAAHDEAVSGLRAEGALAVESARAELTAVLSARHAAELDAVRAPAPRQRRRAQSG